MRSSRLIHSSPFKLQFREPPTCQFRSDGLSHTEARLLFEKKIDGLLQQPGSCAQNQLTVSTSSTTAVTSSHVRNRRQIAAQVRAQTLSSGSFSQRICDRTHGSADSNSLMGLAMLSPGVRPFPRVPEAPRVGPARSYPAVAIAASPSS
mmetsp:Transcript_47984/g.127104  ORF Transcript_47984/g.127104 Transcript_47984/m.127104 type:complete len:149 (+) Transcript_47984:8-454(+)